MLNHLLNLSASLMMSTSVLKALPGKLDIKRHSPSIFYFSQAHIISVSQLFCFDICKTDFFTVIWSKFPIFLGDFLYVIYFVTIF